jgi:hypothetical protein
MVKKPEEIVKSVFDNDFFEEIKKSENIDAQKVQDLIGEKLKLINKSEQNSKLKNFLKQSQKLKNEAHIKKTENINCPDCGFNLYKGGKSLTLCICYGEDWNKNIKIEKSEKSIKMKFPKTVDPENIEMLLETLRSINKE